MSVMNGFRQELFQRVLGLNGHMNVYAMQGALIDYQADARPHQHKCRMCVDVSPTVEAQALVTKDGAASGAYVRGVMPEAIRRRADHCRIISSDGST